MSHVSDDFDQLKELKDQLDDNKYTPEDIKELRTPYDEEEKNESEIDGLQHPERSLNPDEASSMASCSSNRRSSRPEQPYAASVIQVPEIESGKTNGYPLHENKQRANNSPAVSNLSDKEVMLRIKEANAAKKVFIQFLRICIL